MKTHITPFIAVAAVLAITGCTAPATTNPTDDTAKAEPAAVVVPEGEVGRATLESPDGSSSGEVVLVFQHNRFWARLENFETSYDGQLSLAFTDDRLEPGDCLSEKYAIAFVVDGPQPKQGMPLEGWEGDPTFFDSAAIAYYPTSDPVEGECWEKGSSYADLEWNVPDLRPDLSVADSGEQDGAMGEVKLRDGEPVRYTTTSGDILSSIAERFGITVDDIAYLNPNRYHARERTQAYEFEVLNLSKSERGDRLPDAGGN